MTLTDTLLQFAYDSGIFGFMNSRWGWPLVESLHFTGLCLLIGSVGMFDLRLLGLAKTVSLADLHRLIPVGVAGFTLNVFTGALFFISAPAQYLYNPAFQSKIVFMAAAGINMLVFYATTATQVKRAVVTVPLLSRARFMALVSLTCWIGVITCGRLLTFFRPPYHWCFWC